MVSGSYGELLILLALAFNLISGVAFLATALGRSQFLTLARRAYHAMAICVVLASAYLFYLFFAGDYSIKYVYQYSDSTLSAFYTLSAFWGGQEGTYLLWLAFSLACGYGLYRGAGPYRNWAMTTFSLILTFFAVILIKLSPFAPLGFAATDGAGLNPLLQNPWMVIHPPVMFIGYAMAAVPFAIVVAAMIRNDYSDWVARAFPWVTLTALILAAGNSMGGYWAYKTLGWGGYWAWDPVENSSLIPWLVSLALVHSMIMQRRTGALPKSNILLSTLLFVLVLYGTFLTRSGVLADFSVHSFVDLGQNVYLVAFMLGFLLLGLVLFAARAGSLKGAAINYNFWGREFVLVASTVLLFLLSLVVLFGTSLPLLSGIFTDRPWAADAATYNDFALPLAVLYAVFMTFAPETNFSVWTLKNWPVKLAITALIAISVGFVGFDFLLGAGLTFAVLFAISATLMSIFLMRPGSAHRMLPALITFVAIAATAALLGVREPLHIMFFGVAAMTLMASLSNIVAYLPDRWWLAGGQLSHAGFGVLLIGILASSSFSTNHKLLLPLNQSEQAYDLEVTYQGMSGDFADPQNELIVEVVQDGDTTEVRPQFYFSKRLNGIMRRPHVQSSLLFDTYFAPEQIEMPDAPDGVVLARGESQQVGDYAITFDDFEMGEHGDMGDNLTVTARLLIGKDGSVDTLRPSVELTRDEAGHSNYIDHPALLGDDPGIPVTIGQILADQGAIALKMPGLYEPEQTERLAMDVSRKMLIGLVWIGIIMIIAGGTIATVRRTTEAPGN